MRNMMSGAGLAFGLVLAVGIGPARAITFDVLVSDGGTGGLPGVISPCFGSNSSCTPHLDAEGFRFTSTNDGINDHAHVVTAPFTWSDFGQAQSYPSNGTPYIGVDASNISMTSIDGGLFSLLQFDAAESFYNNEVLVDFSQELLVTGFLSGGGTVSSLFTFDGVNDATGPNVDFQTFYLPSSFTNLSSVTFSGRTFSLDNIEVSRTTSRVPEPTSAILLAIGMAGLATRRIWNR